MAAAATDSLAIEDWYQLQLVEAWHALAHGKLSPGELSGDGDAESDAGAEGKAESCDDSNTNTKKSSRTTNRWGPGSALHSMTSREAWLALFEEDPAFRRTWPAYRFLRDELGCIPRSGLSMGCDFVAYEGHPRRYHSKFCVVIGDSDSDRGTAPAIRGRATTTTTRGGGDDEDDMDHEGAAGTVPAGAAPSPPRLTWASLSGLVRNCATVKKKAMLVFPGAYPAGSDGSDGSDGGTAAGFTRRAGDDRQEDATGTVPAFVFSRKILQI